MTLLELLKARYSSAKSYTDKYIKEVKLCLEDYHCEKINQVKKDTTIYDKHLSIKRYELPIPYIYSTHESMLASLFEKPLELVFSGKGQADEDKGNLVKGVYKYLYDKLDLDDFLQESAWWFLLAGFVSSHQNYDVKISGYEGVPGSDGQPMMDAQGQPLQVPIYEWNDPRVFIDNPLKTYFAPDSEFTVKGDKIPFIVREKLVPADEVARTYEVKKEDLPATERLEVGDYKAKDTEAESDIKRVKVMYYCGVIPEENKDEVEAWDAEQKYYAIFTDNKILNISEDEKETIIAKWFGSPNSFFGFGIGKTLRTMQKEMSIRRGQMVRYADLHAYPWLTLDGQTKIDQNALQDILKRKPLVFQGQPPTYLQPPKISDTVIQADQIARSDGQFISGTLDMSKGAQETNTVKTATGQQLFAQSQDKRIEKARKALVKYFKYVVINLFKLARDNWDQEKIIEITDEEGNKEQMPVTGNSLADINFDTDIDIQLATVTLNKDTIAQRAIDLYDKVKDDPLVDRRKIFVMMMKDGFNKKNPERFMLPEGTEGTQPTSTPINPNQPQSPGMPPSPPEGQPQAEAPVMPPEPSMQEQTGNVPLLGNQLAPRPKNQPYG